MKCKVASSSIDKLHDDINVLCVQREMKSRDVNDKCNIANVLRIRIKIIIIIFSMSWHQQQHSIDFFLRYLKIHKKKFVCAVGVPIVKWLIYYILDSSACLKVGKFIMPYTFIQMLLRYTGNDKKIYVCEKVRKLF